MRFRSVGITILAVGMSVLVFSIARRPVRDVAAVPVKQPYGMLPLRFEINQGQAGDQVKFLSRGDGYTLFLTGTESILSLRKPTPIGNADDQGITKSRSFARRQGKTAQRILRMTLRGADRAAQAQGIDEMESRSNYFIGNDPEKWQRNVRNFAKVRYEGIYPGIDLLYYGNQRQLEYDFIVAPDVDPRLIAFDFEGADDIAVDANGDLVLQADGVEIRQHKPDVYQEINGLRQTVMARYALKDDRQIGFEIGPYDVNKPLTIDPVLSYSTYLGGSSNEAGIGIAVDVNGNAYVTGFTESTNFPMAAQYDGSCGTDNNCNGTFEDVFVTKLNPAGTAAIYSTYIGGSNIDIGHAIAVDGSGFAYVTGSTRSTSDFPTVNQISSALNHHGGSEEAFVLKLNATGSGLVYSTLLGGNQSDVGLGLALDFYGAAYVTGSTQSVDFPTTPGAFRQTRLGHGFSAFVTKLTPSGTALYPGAPALAYSTYLAGDCDRDSAGLDIATYGGDDPNDVFLTGFTECIESTNDAAQPNIGGGFWRDAFMAHLNSNGSALLYATYLGGARNDEGLALTLDATGVYVAGSTASSTFPGASTSPIQNTLHGGLDAFVTKFDIATGAIVYSTYLGGSNGESAAGIRVRNGNVYVTGSTSSTDFPGAATSLIQSALRGTRDVFVSELNAQGSAILYATYLGGSGSEGMGTVFPFSPWIGSVAHGLALDPAGNVYLAGSTSSTDFPMVPSATPLQASFGGAPADAFVVKLAPTVDMALTKTASAATVGYSGFYTLVASNVGSFEATNVVVSDPLPSSLAIPKSSAPSTSQGSCSVSGNTVTCNIGSLAAGAHATITIPVTFLTSGTVTNIASVSSGELDFNTANNQATSKISVAKTCATDVTSQLSWTRSGVSAAGVQTFSIRNTGTTAIPATVSVVLDNLAAASLSNKTGDTVCNAPLGNPYKDISVGSDNVLSPGETATVTFQFTRIFGNVSYTPRILAGPGSR